jgi:hypothetical protein
MAKLMLQGASVDIPRYSSIVEYILVLAVLIARIAIGSDSSGKQVHEGLSYQYRVSICAIASQCGKRR